MSSACHGTLLARLPVGSERTLLGENVARGGLLSDALSATPAGGASCWKSANWMPAGLAAGS